MIFRGLHTVVLIGIIGGGSVSSFINQAAAADVEFRPSFAISEEFTDNVFEVANNKKSEYITRLQPGATLHYLSPLWTWDMAYTFEFRNYARNSRSNEYTHDASLRGTVSIIDNFLFLELSDTYHRVSLDVTRNPATESSLFLNQTDQNIAIISPYLLWRPGEKSTLRTGYRYTDTRYWGDGIERHEHGIYADFNREVTSKFSLSAGYAFNRLESQPTQYNRHDLSAGFRYEYADRSFLFGQIGNSWQSFNTGRDTSYLFWNAGVSHDFKLVVATLETRVQSSTDPLAVSTKETSYSGRLEKTLDRGTIGLSASYSEYDNTETGGGDRRRLSFAGTGRYEILQDLTISLSATGERTSRLTVSDYPYRFTGAVGLNYLLKNDLTIGVTYTYVTNLYDLDTTAGANQINRAVVELRKVF